MSDLYVDTSCLVALCFDEPGAAKVRRTLLKAGRLFSANLLEAELRAALFRERVSEEPVLLGRVSWVIPDRPLGAEIRRVCAAGYLRGADLWHLACALYLADEPGALGFATLDKQQASVARALGFGAPRWK